MGFHQWLEKEQTRLIFIPPATLLLIVGFALLAPVMPSPVATGLDESWVWALNLAKAQGLEFGRDLIFTYGPLANAVTPIYSMTPLWQYQLLSGFCYAAMFLSLARIWWHLRPDWRSITVPAVALFAFLPICWFYIEYHELAVVLAACSALLRPRIPRLEGFLLASLTALAFSIKFNTFFVCLGVTLSVALIATWRERQQRRTALTLAAAALLGSVALFSFLSSPANLPMYVKGVLEISSGYSSGLSMIGPIAHLMVALLSLAALFVLIPALADQGAALLPGLLPAFFFTFAAFKHSFVRQDSHVLSFQPKIAIASLFLLVLARTRRDASLLAAFAVGSVLFGIALRIDTFADTAQVLAYRLRGNQLRDWTLSLVNPSAEMHATNTKAAKRFPPGWLDEPTRQRVAGKTVDVAPHRIDIIGISQLRWRPRPVIGSYSTYTPWLDRWNAESIARNGADKIILRREEIDGRVQLWEDPATTWAMINWYDPELLAREHLLLTRRSAPKFADPQPAGTATIGWNQPVAAPEAGPGEVVLMRARIRESWRGKLTTTLLRGPEVRIIAQYANGMGSSGRIVPANLDNFTMLGPWPYAVADLLNYFEAGRNGLIPAVKTIEFYTPGAGHFQPQILIEWFKAKRRPGPDPSFDPASFNRSMEPLWRPGQPIATFDLRPISPGRFAASTIDPQMILTGRDFSEFRTLLVRARFHQQAELIDLFFGTPLSPERRVGASVPLTGQWLDIYFNTGEHPEWRGPVPQLRLDPVSKVTEFEIEGVWGSKLDAPHPLAPVTFYPADATLPGLATPAVRVPLRGSK